MKLIKRRSGLIKYRLIHKHDKKTLDIVESHLLSYSIFTIHVYIIDLKKNRNKSSKS